MPKKENHTKIITSQIVSHCGWLSIAGGFWTKINKKSSSRLQISAGPQEPRRNVRAQNRSRYRNRPNKDGLPRSLSSHSLLLSYAVTCTNSSYTWSFLEPSPELSKHTKCPRDRRCRRHKRNSFQYCNWRKSYHKNLRNFFNNVAEISISGQWVVRQIPNVTSF